MTFSAVPDIGLRAQTLSPHNAGPQSLRQLAELSALNPERGAVEQTPSPQVGVQSCAQLVASSAVPLIGAVVQIPSPQVAMQSLAQFEAFSAVPLNGFREQTPSPHTGELQSLGQLAALSTLYPDGGLVEQTPSPQVGAQSLVGFSLVNSVPP